MPTAISVSCSQYKEPVIVQVVHLSVLQGWILLLQESAPHVSVIVLTVDWSVQVMVLKYELMLAISPNPPFPQSYLAGAFLFGLFAACINSHIVSKIKVRSITQNITSELLVRKIHWRTGARWLGRLTSLQTPVCGATIFLYGKIGLTFDLTVQDTYRYDNMSVDCTTATTQFFRWVQFYACVWSCDVCSPVTFQQLMSLVSHFTVGRRHEARPIS